MIGIGRATLESQLGSAPCLIEDTESMFWMREADDYQNRFSLGNALSAQYRFRDAIRAYEKALRIRQDDWKLYYGLGGAYLTIRHFDEAAFAYHRCMVLREQESTVAYPLGISHYLQKDYAGAAMWFKKCLPCDDEMAIAVIYWHTLSCYRAGDMPILLNSYHQNMVVGHHTAYKVAVSVFSKETSWTDAMKQLEQETDDLHYIVAVYGLCGYLEQLGEQALRDRYMAALLKRSSVWPCVSYLAAWGDLHGMSELPEIGTAK